MINNEVPTACFIGKLAKNNRAGMIKTSTSAQKPIMRPTKKPTTASTR
jgi:hypothetical protein